MVDGPKAKSFGRLIEEADLKYAAELAESGELDDAWDIVNARLTEAPNDVMALTLATSIQWKAKRLPISYQLAKAALREAPKLSTSWLNMGVCAESLYLEAEAERAYRMALQLHPKDKPRKKGYILTNYSSLLLTVGKWAAAEAAAREACELDPSPKSFGNLGLSLLAQRKWREGWSAYQHVQGTDQARGFSYGAADWDGSPDRRLVVHGEQGLGDEINFASMLPDAIRDASKVIIDCEPKLANLFRRSFPAATVYGTRWKKVLNWSEEDRTFDASCSIGSLGRFYRNAEADFPGTPYLTPDLERMRMWRGMFAQLAKPVIGIAWTGGVSHTGERFRKLDLKQLWPMFSAVKAHWVSLQYKDVNEEISGTPVHQYGWATLTDDYDDTAALVASCDIVVSMQTAVVHTAGALGKDCIVLVPRRGQWRYADPGPTIPWYKSVHVVHQARDDWSAEIAEVTRLLTERFASRLAA